MNFNTMADNKDVYNAIWGDRDLSSFNITNTIHQGKPSKNSYQFNNKNDTSTKNQTDILMTLFNISNKKDFLKKYKMAVSGFEKQRILRLHSSSLCALLFFYSCDSNNITLNLFEEDIVFSKVFFEWKNKALSTDSNIDVALYSIESNAILFLESKFSEYISSVKNTLNIPIKYKENEITKTIYEELIESTDYESDFSTILYNQNKKKVKGFKIHSKRSHYIDGTKQMISHYLGIRNLINGDTSEENTYLSEVTINSKTRYYFGEIVFDFKLQDLKMKTSKISKEITYFDDYQNKYNELKDILDKDIARNNITNFKIIPNLLRYSMFDIPTNEIEPLIKKFYFGH